MMLVPVTILSSSTSASESGIKNLATLKIFRQKFFFLSFLMISTVFIAVNTLTNVIVRKKTEADAKWIEIGSPSNLLEVKDSKPGAT